MWKAWLGTVADPGCLSRNPDPDFLPIPDPGSRIPDPGKNSNKREGWKKICCHNFLCSHKFHKIANYFSFEVLKKKIWPNFQGIIELFTQKIVTKLSKIWIWDPGSEIRDPEKKLFRIPDPGVKKAPDPGSGSATLVTTRLRIWAYCWTSTVPYHSYPRPRLFEANSWSESGPRKKSILTVWKVQNKILYSVIQPASIIEWL